MSSIVWGCVFINAEWVLSLLLHCMSDLLNLSSMPVDGLLNRSMVGLGNPGLISVDPISNEEYISALVS